MSYYINCRDCGIKIDIVEDSSGLQHYCDRCHRLRAAEAEIDRLRRLPSVPRHTRCREGGIMMKDWIDREKTNREKGHHRALTQSQHAEVNARYPGCTLEYCCECGNPTGNAGKGEDSLYTSDGEGPYCWECWQGLAEDVDDILDAGKGEE